MAQSTCTCQLNFGLVQNGRKEYRLVPALEWPSVPDQPLPLLFFSQSFPEIKWMQPCPETMKSAIHSRLRTVIMGGLALQSNGFLTLGA